MSFFETDKQIPDESVGLLYILIVEIGDETVFKIGVTQRKIQDRVAEIVVSFWHQYRYFPKVYPKRFTSTTNVWKKEAQMHAYFKEHSYKPEHKFGGSSEFFKGIELDHLLAVYSRCLAGEELCST